LTAVRPLRLAVLVDLVPRKLGSLEGWLVGVAREARARGHKFDVFSRGPAHPDFLAALAGAGGSWELLDPVLRRPVAGVRRLRGYDVIQLNLFGARSRAAMVAYAAWPARVLFVERTSAYSAARLSPAGRLKRWLLNAVTVPRIAGLAGVSDYARTRTARQLGIEESRTVTIYNGVDLDRFAPAPHRSVGGPPTILVVAHLIREKGVDVLLRAVARIDPRSARLLVVGDGPELTQLRALAATLGIKDRTEFAGLRDDVPSCLQNADVFVHPAVWAEAFGWTIAEAMASGCAVIASRTGGIPELIVHEETGVLVEPGDAGAIGSALTRLLESPELRARLAGAARRRVEERFSLKGCAARHVDWCERVTAVEAPQLDDRTW
jgi:glycosyltransferase involved in cell wall biosynthesis